MTGETAASIEEEEEEEKTSSSNESENEEIDLQARGSEQSRTRLRRNSGGNEELTRSMMNKITAINGDDSDETGSEAHASFIQSPRNLSQGSSFGSDDVILDDFI